MSEQHQDHVNHEPQHQDVYQVTDSTPTATRIAVLENEVTTLKTQLHQAQQQANMVPELLGLMARLAARYMPDENGNVSISLPVLTATQQALFTAASRLLPVGSLGHHAPETPDEALAAAHAAGMSYPGAEVNGGLAESPHPAMQHAADQLAQFLAMQGGGAFDALKKRKSDGTPSFGRGAPGQKRFCPLCKNSDGSPTPLAGNHNATCPWCKKCWARKQQVLKVDCPLHNPPESATPSHQGHGPPMAAAAMPPMPDGSHHSVGLAQDHSHSHSHSHQQQQQQQQQQQHQQQVDKAHAYAQQQQQQQQQQHHASLSHHHQHQAEAMDHQHLPVPGEHMLA